MQVCTTLALLGILHLSMCGNCRQYVVIRYHTFTNGKHHRNTPMLLMSTLSVIIAYSQLS